jgi:hypothetical protein
VSQHFENAETSQVPTFMTASGLASSAGSDAKRIQRKPDAVLITKCRRLPLFKADPAVVERFLALEKEIFGTSKN